LTYLSAWFCLTSSTFGYKLIAKANKLNNKNDKVMSIKETFTVTGENLLKRIKELIAEGNVTKITITDKNGKEIMNFPVTLGVIGVVLAPIFAAVGAIAALLTECKITVERTDKAAETEENTEVPVTPQTEEKSEGTTIEVH